MKLRILAIFSLMVFALASTGITSAEGVRKRLKFAKGSSSATVSGAVVRGDSDTFIVGAREGQTMSVNITSLEDNAVFQVREANGDYLEDAGEGDDATSWSGDLPSTGDYEIIVGGTRGNASYKLTVSIK